MIKREQPAPAGTLDRIRFRYLYEGVGMDNETALAEACLNVPTDFHVTFFKFAEWEEYERVVTRDGSGMNRTTSSMWRVEVYVMASRDGTDD